jgi:hypothetical protein
MNNGFYLFVEYGEKFRRLSDAQLGHLIRSLMDYKVTGNVPEIDDLAVGLAFDIVRADIDKQAEAYRKKQEAGAKGGSGRKQTEADGSTTKQTEAESSKPKQTKANGTNKKEKENKKENEKDIVLPLTPSKEGERTISEPVMDAVKEWLEYKKERREPYKAAGYNALLTQIEKAEREHGASAVINLIHESMANGWRGIIWDRLKKPKKELSLAEQWGITDTDIWGSV